jgi:uncharacterized protein YcbK (DUF882 family)
VNDQYFSVKELSCHHCGVMPWGDAAIERLNEFRRAFGEPMIVSSGYRCPEHNAAVSHTGRDGPHTVADGDSICVDVLVSGDAARRLLYCALERKVPGIGVHQRGKVSQRFVHLDWTPAATSRPRPWIWSY